MLAPYSKLGDFFYLASPSASMSPSPKVGGLISTNPIFGAPKCRTQYLPPPPWNNGPPISTYSLRLTPCESVTDDARTAVYLHIIYFFAGGPRPVPVGRGGWYLFMCVLVEIGKIISLLSLSLDIWFWSKFSWDMKWIFSAIWYGADFGAI